MNQLIYTREGTNIISFNVKDGERVNETTTPEEEFKATQGIVAKVVLEILKTKNYHLEGEVLRKLREKYCSNEKLKT